MIVSECIFGILPFHHNEGNAVGEGPCLVGSTQEQIKVPRRECRIGRDNLGKGISTKRMIQIGEDRT